MHASPSERSSPSHSTRESNFAEKDPQPTVQPLASQRTVGLSELCRTSTTSSTSQRPIDAVASAVADALETNARSRKAGTIGTDDLSEDENQIPDSDEDDVLAQFRKDFKPMDAAQSAAQQSAVAAAVAAALKLSQSGGQSQYENTSHVPTSVFASPDRRNKGASPRGPSSASQSSRSQQAQKSVNQKSAAEKARDDIRARLAQRRSKLCAAKSSLSSETSISSSQPQPYFREASATTASSSETVATGSSGGRATPKSTLDSLRARIAVARGKERSPLPEARQSANSQAVASEAESDDADGVVGLGFVWNLNHPFLTVLAKYRLC